MPSSTDGLFAALWNHSSLAASIHKRPAIGPHGIQALADLRPGWGKTLDVHGCWRTLDDQRGKSEVGRAEVTIAGQAESESNDLCGETGQSSPGSMRA